MDRDPSAADPSAAERDGEDPRVLARLERERRILQQVIGVAGIVPVAAGLYGVLFGAGLTGDRLGVAGDSHYRYLSGLLLAIGLLFWSSIPAVELRGPRVRLLTLVVLVGGLARLWGFALGGPPPLTMIGALAMELVVTPAVCLWQWRIARAYAVPDGPAAPLTRARPAPPGQFEEGRDAGSSARPDRDREPIPRAGEPLPVPANAVRTAPTHSAPQVVRDRSEETA